MYPFWEDCKKKDTYTLWNASFIQEHIRPTFSSSEHFRGFQVWQHMCLGCNMFLKAVVSNLRDPFKGSPDESVVADDCTKLLIILLLCNLCYFLGKCCIIFPLQASANYQNKWSGKAKVTLRMSYTDIHCVTLWENGSQAKCWEPLTKQKYLKYVSLHMVLNSSYSCLIKKYLLLTNQRS